MKRQKKLWWESKSVVKICLGSNGLPCVSLVENKVRLFCCCLFLILRRLTGLVFCLILSQLIYLHKTALPSPTHTCVVTWFPFHAGTVICEFAVCESEEKGSWRLSWQWLLVVPHLLAACPRPVAFQVSLPNPST